MEQEDVVGVLVAVKVTAVKVMVGDAVEADDGRPIFPLVTLLLKGFLLPLGNKLVLFVPQ